MSNATDGCPYLIMSWNTQKGIWEYRDVAKDNQVAMITCYDLSAQFPGVEFWYFRAVAGHKTTLIREKYIRTNGYWEVDGEEDDSNE